MPAPRATLLALSLLATSVAFYQPRIILSHSHRKPSIATPQRSRPLFAVATDATAKLRRAKPLAPPPDDEDIPLPQTAIVLLLCCAIGAVCALDRVLMSVAILPMAEQYSYSDSTKGLIAAGFSIGYCLGLLPTGAAAATGSPKFVLLCGLLVWSIAQAATPAAAAIGVPSLLAARAVMGCGEAAAVPSLQAVAARFVPASRRSLFWGCLCASLSSGTLAAYVITSPLIDENGWPFVFEAFGALGLLLAIVWSILGADAPTRAGTATTTKPAAAASSSSSSLADVPWREISASKPVWALAAAHMSTNFFMYFGLSWLPTYFSYQFGLSTADASSASLYPFAAGAIGSLTAGALCDQLVARFNFTLTDARKLMQTIGCGGPAIAMFILCLLSAGVGGLQLNRDEAESLFIFGVFFQTASAAGYGCGAQDISTRLSSLIYGSTSVLAVLAGASGQYFTGWLLEQNGRDFTPMFALVVLVELAGLFAWNAWWDSERAFE